MYSGKSEGNGEGYIGASALLNIFELTAAAGSVIEITSPST